MEPPPSPHSGYAHPNVPAYSSHYASADKKIFSSRESYRHEADGVYFGAKFQCVEFSRRYLVNVYGFTFASIGMAYEIFDLPSAIRVKDEVEAPFHRFFLLLLESFYLLFILWWCWRCWWS